MDVRIVAGTSGFAYKEWKGSFYPEDLAGEAMLGHYASRLPSVEINNTFYRMPSKRVLASWASEVPAGFTFAFKASRFITHMKRLKEASEPVAYLFAQLEAVGSRLGPVLFQCPPNLKLDLARLDGFLATLPAGRQMAMEFRHPSWFDPEVYERLRARGVALCAVEVAAGSEAGEGSPLVRTADFAYVRLRQEEYTDEALAAWARRLRETGVSEAWVYFKHEDAGAGPRLASRFLGLLT